MKKKIASRIVYELSKTSNGLTIAELLKKINDKQLTRQNVMYHINQFIDEDVIARHGTVYKLLRKTFIVNGCAVIEFEDNLTFTDCYYYGNTCKRCYNTHLNPNERCQFIEDLPDFLRVAFNESK